MEEVNAKKVAADVEVLIDDIEALLRITATETGERIVGLRRRTQESIARCRTDLLEQRKFLFHRAERVKTTINAFFRENPWGPVTGAIAVGVVLGLLLRKRA